MRECAGRLPRGEGLVSPPTDCIDSGARLEQQARSHKRLRRRLHILELLSSDHAGNLEVSKDLPSERPGQTCRQVGEFADGVARRTVTCSLRLFFIASK